MGSIIELRRALLAHGVPELQIQNIPLSHDVPPHQQGWQGGVQVYTGLAHSHPRSDGAYLVSTAHAENMHVTALGQLSAAERAAQFLAHTAPGMQHITCEHCRPAHA